MLSASVSTGFKTLRDLQLIKGTEETEQFCYIFDRYFDMMNTRSLDEGLRRRKPDLKAYEDVKDARFHVCVICNYYQYFNVSAVA